MKRSTNDTTAPDRAPEAQPTSESGPSPSSRRTALRRLGKAGLGAAALSFATFGPSVRKAFAQSADGPVAILNFALTLEYLESVYYSQGVDESDLLPDRAAEVYTLISEHENEHVAALRAAITGEGGEPVGGDEGFTIDDFDFTAGGAVPDPFGNYDVYLALSQAFEDTGVRAYKGQAANIPSDLTLVDGGFNALTTALQIHSLEARHAAEVRRLRAARGADVEPWVSDPLAGFSSLGLSDAASSLIEMVYDGEENLTQAGVDLGDALDYSDERIAEAFDETLDMDEVLDIADPFTMSDLDGDGDDAS